MANISYVNQSVVIDLSQVFRIIKESIPQMYAAIVDVFSTQDFVYRIPLCHFYQVAGRLGLMAESG
jgi:hypothetical protein